MNPLGDFQTPPALAAQVVAAVRARGVEPARIFEPTCGSGAFLRAAATAFPAAQIIGVEYQRERYGAALAAVCAERPTVTAVFADAYQLDVAALPWERAGPLLIVGNPPWITAAALGRVRSGALQPPRSNLKRLRGLDARTGAANFDVAEFLILKLLRDLREQPLDLALLVKESVARNVLAAAASLGVGVTTAEIVRIDARAWFGVHVDACCLLLAARPGMTQETVVVARDDFAGIGRPVRIHAAARAAAPPAFAFRAGIKHDAAAVFELQRVGVDAWRNGLGELVDIEPAFIFPYLKARALHHGEIEPAMGLVVTQRRLGDDTDTLRLRAPRLWRYLERHAERLAVRKSSIYRGQPAFAIFGIGPYSFARWKVAVAGFYREARFRVVGPQRGQPVMLGDTAYFVAFESEASARAFAERASNGEVRAQIAARAVRGKRPITKALLDSIDWGGGFP